MGSPSATQREEMRARNQVRSSRVASSIAATFGKTTVGASSDSFRRDRKRVNRYLLPVSGAVTKLTVYLAPTRTAGKQVIRVGDVPSPAGLSSQTISGKDPYALAAGIDQLAARFGLKPLSRNPGEGADPGLDPKAGDGVARGTAPHPPTPPVWAPPSPALRERVV